ncbi:MAG TPA: hypothetical protein VIR38_10935 [Thalassobaculum sp.]
MTAATASAEARKETPEVDEAEAEAGIVCVLDLGEHRRKRVRKLRKGEGRLMDKVEEAVASLQEQGVLRPDAQTVVVVVREEWSLKGMLDDDDDDDD